MLGITGRRLLLVAAIRGGVNLDEAGGCAAEEEDAAAADVEGAVAEAFGFGVVVVVLVFSPAPSPLDLRACLNDRAILSGGHSMNKTFP